MRRLILATAVAAVGCQPTAPNPSNAPSVPVPVAPAPTGEMADPPTISKPAPVTFVSEERLAGSDPLTAEEALFLIARFDHREEVLSVIALGERLFPAFEEILNNPATSQDDQGKVLGLLGGMKGDRSRFMDHALRRLSSKDVDLRRAAVGFLGWAGTEREAALVTVMLLDKDSTVQYAAADSLVRIGGEREVAVFELILHNARRYEEDGFLILGQHMLDVYEKCRDELVVRLKQEKKDRPKAEPADKK